MRISLALILLLFCFQFLNAILYSRISFFFLLVFSLLVESKAQSYSDDGFGLYRFDITLGSAML
jgi:hypothetical protein